MPSNEYELVSKTNIASETRERDGSEPPDNATNVRKRNKASNMKRIWHRVTSLFDTKPYEVRETWGTITWHLSKRLFTLCILVGAITLGILQQSFNITDRSIWQRFQINEDAQLAAFGLLNTVLALMVRDSLSHITDIVVTRWMISGHGASPLDFEMYDETIKPWRAIANVHARRKHNGWNIRDGLRFTICAVTGVCLLLQGASMNTIGLPKIRWWPDTRFMKVGSADERLFLKRPTMHVANVSYMSMWQRSFDAFKEGGLVSWEMAHAFGAMSTLGALESIHSTFSQEPGWTLTSDRSAMIQNAVNVTNSSTTSVKALSIHAQEVVTLWDERQNSKLAGIRRARGWEAKLKLNGILFDTSCSETPDAVAGSWKALNQGNGTIMVRIGPNLQPPIPGATCSVTISQALIDVTQWIILDNLDRDRPGYSIDNYGQDRDPSITHISPSTADHNIAEQLTNWFNAILPNLQLLSSNSEVANLTSLVSRLSHTIVKLNRGHTIQDGLAAILSIIFSNLLTTFSWGFEELPDTTTQHGPIRWQIYGSGPRLPWQWVSAAVIGVSIIVQIVDVMYILWHRNAKGTWLTLGGMLVAANAAERTPTVGDEQGAGFLSDEARFVKFYVRQRRGGDGDEAGKAMLVDEVQVKGEGTRLERLEEDLAYG